MAVKDYEFPLLVGRRVLRWLRWEAGAVSMDYLIFGEAGKEETGSESGKE